MAAFSIFISYRRRDTPAAAGVLYDALASKYGEANVFMDVELEPGQRFDDVIMERVHSCDVLIALIGPTWLAAEGDEGRRLDEPDDLVRREVVAALERGAVVIPVLVGEVEMPKPSELPDDLKVLAGIHSFSLGLTRDYHTERKRLIRYLDKIRDSRPGFLSRSTHLMSGNHRRLVQAAAVGAVIVAAVLVGVAIAGRLGSGSTSETGDGGGMSSADSINTELIKAHVPEPIRESCNSIAPIGRSYLGSVRCSQGAAGQTVTYSRAHNVSALVSDFKGAVSDASLDPNTAGRASCRKALLSGERTWGAWSRDLAQVHVQPPNGKSQGRVLCYQTSSTAWIIWTDGPTKLLGQASRPVADRARLYEWWRTDAGPEKDRPEMGAMTAPGPWGTDGIENKLLLAHVPGGTARTCRRSPSLPDEMLFLRAVECPQGRGLGQVEYAYAHSGSALQQQADHEMTNNSIDHFEGTCLVDAVAAWPWRRQGSIGHIEPAHREGSEGRVICLADPRGDATIEWTDNTTGIWASASRPYKDRRALYDWWRTKAGPGIDEEGMDMGGGTGSMPTTSTTMTGGMKG